MALHSICCLQHCCCERCRHAGGGWQHWLQHQCSLRWPLSTLQMMPGAASRQRHDSLQVFMLPTNTKLDTNTLRHILRMGHSRVPVHEPGDRWACCSKLVLRIGACMPQMIC